MHRIKNIKKTILTIQLSIPVIFLSAFLLGGESALSESYLWILYVVTTTLTLPSLISKVLLGNTLLGFSTVISFLYYPIGFLIGFGLNSIFGIDMQVPLTLFGLFSIVLWNALLFFFIKEENKKYLFWISDKTVTSVFTSVLITIGILILFRQINSVVATDYLQHQSVVNNMLINQALCLLPSECSNLFLQDGYTTFFHTIWSALSFNTLNSLSKTFFIVDLIWPILIGLVTFKYATRIFKNDLIASLGVAIATLTFVNWAYEFNFLIPQTFVFFLFLNLITLKDLSPRKLIIGSLVLILGHFVIGVFLAGVLVIKFVVIKYWQDAYGKSQKMNTIIYISFLFVLLSLLLNIAGFSIENALQQKEVAYIGAATNELFPKNIETILAPMGFLTIMLIISIVYYFINKKKNREVFFSIVYICINLSLFFLAPTYAGKFMIGFGIFAAIIILSYVKDLKLEPKPQLALIILIVVGLFANFGINLTEYLKFYSREENIVSALTNSDEGLIKYLNNHNLKCIILSDPYTQIVVAGTTGYQTAAGQYMSLEARESIMTFINEPSETNYSNLSELTEINDEKFCFLYSSRLEGSLYENRSAWTVNIYTLPIRNDYNVVRNQGLRNYMETTGKSILYEDSYYVLFSSN